MWTRKDSEIPTGSPNPPEPSFRSPAAEPAPPARPGERANIGRSICIRGELTGNEDLTIEGKIEGKVNLQEHHLTIGNAGRIQAEVRARSVTVRGEVVGNIHATEKIEIANSGRVTGDLCAPRVVIAEGAFFKGTVDMPGESTRGAAKEALASAPPAKEIKKAATA